MASLFGGRADVRVRMVDALVRLLDFTSMYPTVFCLLCLQELLVAPQIGTKVVTSEIRRLVGQMARGKPLAVLYDPKTWRLLNCLVLVDPQWAVLPIRFRKRDQDPYTVAVTPVDTPEGRWCTLADVIAGILLGGPAPKVLRAIRFVPKGRHEPKSTMFRGAVELRSDGSIFKTIVEQKQTAKGRSCSNADMAGLETGLKVLANSGAYGIYAEINSQPGNLDKPIGGDVYADVCFESPKIHDERPGGFANPILASLITGGARLVLAMLECEVNERGGTFAFCDTDSLAIVCGGQCPNGIPSVTQQDVKTILERFDALNPYERTIVPHLLKVEYPDIHDLRCFAVSAKRYVLYRIRPGNRIQIVKASESGLGAIIGRSSNETTSKLARRIWLRILMAHLKVNPKQRRRAKPLVDFDVPMRRKFPISQPSILERLAQYNKGRSYEHRIKPFGFVQSVTPAVIGSASPIPIAPFERDVARSKRLQWVDYETGNPLRLDWIGSNLEGTFPVMRLSEYVDQYHRHPEAKAADWQGNAAGPDTIGLLGRLRLKSGRLARIGKEIDRLDQDEGAAIRIEQPQEYPREELAEDIAYLATFPQEPTARDLGLTARAWRNIRKGLVTRPRPKTIERITYVAATYRGSRGNVSVNTSVRGHGSIAKSRGTFREGHWKTASLA